MPESDTTPTLDFIREIVADDLEAGKHATIVTRFPPEPNGYLHIGHAKSICLNFGIAAQFGGRCHLRYDDTNPTKEEMEYIESIERDVRWLGFDWGAHLYFASDYFEQMYAWAELLVGKGKAYVCDCTPDEVRARRGTLTEPGRPCAHRDRPAAESLDLFRRMRAGEFPDGSRVLRARIDMASGNVNMRDPVIYRILHAAHPHVGDAWCVYPMYDYAHPLEDAIERITHSICTLEFEDHRPFYDWVIDECEIAEPHPRQIEFARLNLTNTVMSKRKLLQLVQEGLVRGWDDPRMPTISGLRRRGVPPAAIRDFADRIGVAKRDTTVDVQLLEHCVREELNAARAAADGGAAAGQAGHRQLPRGRSSRSSRSPTTPRTRRPARGRCRSAGRCGSSRTTSARRRRPSTGGCSPATRCGCARPTWCAAPASSRTRAARSSRSTRPTTRRAAAATPRTAAR